MNGKTHYRKAYKSDHLGIADLEEYIEEGRQLTFTIDYVKYQQNVSVAGRKGNHNIAYFKDKIKPWVINATNGKILKGFAGSSFIEDWSGLFIQLYIDPTVKMKGEITGGVRVMTQQPRKSKPELLPTNAQQWGRAILAYQRDGNLNSVLKHMSISSENTKAIADAANA